MADVGCAGILVADTFCGPMSVPPKEGALTLVDPFLIQVGGCAANTGVDLAKQGISVDIAGMIGDDAPGRIVVDGLKAGNTSVTQVKTSATGTPTSQTVILIVAGQDRRYVHNFGANADFKVSDIDRDWVKGLKLFCLGGLFALPAINIDELRDLLDFCRDNDVITVVDVVMSDQYDKGMAEIERLLPAVDFFTPNDDEAALLIGGETDPVRQLKTFHDCGAANVIITLGENGAVATDGNDLWSVGTFAVDTVDPSGGGDAFAAGAIAGILQDRDMGEILVYGSALGASCATAVGCTAGVLNRDAVDAFMNSQDLKITSQPLR